MVLATTLLVLTLMVVPLLLLRTMGRFGKEQAATERILLSPQAHTDVVDRARRGRTRRSYGTRSRPRTGSPPCSTAAGTTSGWSSECTDDGS